MGRLDFISRGKTTAIGLDIGGRHAKAVQLEKADRASGWRLAAVAHAGDIVALVLQNFPQRIADVRIVIHHQDAAARP